MKTICVIGSSNVDYVTTVERFPKPGETISGLDFSIFPGGKGANQAVALAKTGIPTNFLTSVGNDDNAQIIKDNLENYGIDTKHINNAPTFTGIATIYVDESSQNQIVVVDGANAFVNVEYLKQVSSIIENSDIIMMQLETPVEALDYIVNNYRDKYIVLDPAPAKNIDKSILANIDLISPNETELSFFSKIEITNEDDLLQAIKFVESEYNTKVIAKCGSKGAYFVEADTLINVPAFKVEAIDTTAAGDAFNAGLIYGLSNEKSVKDSIVYANAFGALATTKHGAQSAFPTIEEVESFIGKNNE